MEFCILLKNKMLSSLSEMAIFTQVVEVGSFTQAAIVLNLDTSAVSRAVSKLEKTLNTQLLQRTTRQLCLTENGAEIYQHCKDMLLAAERAITTSQQLQAEVSGGLRLYAPRALGKVLIHPLVMQFIRIYPKVKVNFILDDRPIDLIHEKIDIEFRITDQPSVGLMGRKLNHIEQILCAHPEYLANFGEPYTPQEIKQHRCITLSDRLIDTRWKFKSKYKTCTIDVESHYSVNHSGARLDAALQGIGIATLPKFVALRALEEGNVQHVLSDWTLQTNYQGDVWMLYAPSKHVSKKVQLFREFIVNALRHENV